MKFLLESGALIIFLKSSSLNPLVYCLGMAGSLLINPRSPYMLVPTQAILNSMRLVVRVPVLSEKMCSIWPNSSLSEALLTSVPFFRNLLYMNLSLLMK